MLRFFIKGLFWQMKAMNSVQNQFNKEAFYLYPDSEIDSRNLYLVFCSKLTLSLTIKTFF